MIYTRTCLCHKGLSSKCSKRHPIKLINFNSSFSALSKKKTAMDNRHSRNVHVSSKSVTLYNNTPNAFDLYYRSYFILCLALFIQSKLNSIFTISSLFKDESWRLHEARRATAEYHNKTSHRKQKLNLIYKFLHTKHMPLKVEVFWLWLYNTN